jgi:hypothetical protein
MNDTLPNPERRSDAAVLCFSIGISLIALSWFLGLGGAVSLAFSGAWTPAEAGGIAAFILVPVTTVCGALFVAVGSIWIVIRVIVDQRRDHATDRYSRDVER